MARRRPKPSSKAKPDTLRAQFLDAMARESTAESLNDRVIAPFVSALETVCSERGYILNIYGERSNLVFTSPEDAEAIYALVEQYLDAKEEDE